MNKVLKLRHQLMIYSIQALKQFSNNGTIFNCNCNLKDRYLNVIQRCNEMKMLCFHIEKDRLRTCYITWWCFHVVFIPPRLS
jgi:hypothetical protein